MLSAAEIFLAVEKRKMSKQNKIIIREYITTEQKNISV